MSWYIPNKHGSIEDFIEYCKTERIPTCFKGFEQYKMLWDQGFLEPNVSVIQLAYGVGPDETYILINESQVKGMPAGTHFGKEGIHNIKELLNDRDLPYWRAGELNLPPKPK